ncbi:hypothetical protein, partial [Bradyrhizobium sp. 147]|uniref:hypothetical protein n=1 Tax=Bradyrhizobium sp. 147 TaxID=2782623 RepID=UPI001FFB7694
MMAAMAIDQDTSAAMIEGVLCWCDVNSYRFQCSILQNLGVYTLVDCHSAFQFSPTLLVKKREQTKSIGHVVAIKNIVIPLEVEYLQKAAKERGISRSKLVRFVMEKVVNDEL